MIYLDSSRWLEKIQKSSYLNSGLMVINARVEIKISP